MIHAQTFPSTAEAVSQARRYVAQCLPEVGRAVADSVALIVSELATNSIEHAGTPFTVDIEQMPGRVRIGVTDWGAGTPAVRHPEPVAPTGRGLRIVQSLAAEWGVSRSPKGEKKTVWFTILTA